MDYDRIEWKEGLRRLQEAQTEIVKLRQRLARERERCIAVVFGQCESDNVAQRTADAIRAMGDEG